MPEPSRVAQIHPPDSVALLAAFRQLESLLKTYKCSSAEQISEPLRIIGALLIIIGVSVWEIGVSVWEITEVN